MVGFTSLSTALALLATASVASASPSKPWPRADYAVKETHPVPAGWRKLARASPHHTIDLQIGLAQGNWDELERHLYEVSDPDHVRYGQHLSAAEVNALVRPSDETSDMVHDWLAAEGIDTASVSYSAAGDWLLVSLPVATAERLLDAEYHTYEHADGSRLVRSPEWSLPRALHAHIDTVQPTTSFLRARAAKFEHIQDGFPDEGHTLATYTPPPDNSTLNAVCNISSVTPECFATLYETKGYTTQAKDRNSIAFTNYLGEHPIRSDLELFLMKYRPEALSSVNYTKICLADGPCEDSLNATEIEKGTSKEANLDIQALAGIGHETPITSYSTGGRPPWIAPKNKSRNSNEPYLVWVNWLLNQTELPQVISTSYADEEQTVPPSYAHRVCRQFAQVGARGTSMLFASGDDGVGPSDESCTRFTAMFPSSCPFITTVGATRNFAPEVVAYRLAFVDPDGKKHGNYTSGGGFSDYFATPAYQRDVVENYIRNLNGTYDGMYNKSGRGYPDVSAQGLYFAIVWNGTEGVISGTSASTPLFAGIVALVNDALLAEGKPALGFLNPWLYRTAYQGLNDVVGGSAHGCLLDGFPAVEGWDAVTGLGTPNFPKLVELAGGSLPSNYTKRAERIRRVARPIRGLAGKTTTGF